MALEAVVYPQQDPLLSYCFKESYGTLGSGSWNHDFTTSYSPQFSVAEGKPYTAAEGGQFHNPPDIPSSVTTTTSPSSVILQEWRERDHHHPYPNSSPETCAGSQQFVGPGEAIINSPAHGSPAAAGAGSGGGGRRKRRRSVKNKEEVENQRMTHIAVERNRRKQMNEYLAVIRTLMPPSYVQRGDQASIIGGAINYVKELEQRLHSLETHNRINQQRRQQLQEEHRRPDTDLTPATTTASPAVVPRQPPIFADFFALPQFSARSSPNRNKSYDDDDGTGDNYAAVAENYTATRSANNNHEPSASGANEIEVTLVDGHANVKILTKRQSKQILKLVVSFRSIRFSVLHLNVTATVDDMVLYSFSLKVEEGCHLNSVEEIAAATNQILQQIHDQTSLV